MGDGTDWDRLERQAEGGNGLKREEKAQESTVGEQVVGTSAVYKPVLSSSTARGREGGVAAQEEIIRNNVLVVGGFCAT